MQYLLERELELVLGEDAVLVPVRLLELRLEGVGGGHELRRAVYYIILYYIIPYL
jgi:hypothetical protein